MEISGSAAVSALANATTNQELSVKVLKKALDTQASSALALINALPEPPQSASNLPDHIGRTINTTA
jgi:hypothetical protein